jgi:hypothetical protein
MLSVAGTTTICSGQTTQLTASGATTYSWAPATGLTATNVANPTFNGTAPQTYTVMGTTDGCTGTTTVTVTVNPNPTVTINQSPAGPICSGQTKLLTASGATTYLWSPATGLTATNVANPTFNGTAPQTYTVMGTTDGCTSTTVVTVQVNTNPIANAGVDESICESVGTANLNATASTGVGPLSYSWLPATHLDNPASATPVFTNSVSGTYTYTVTVIDAGSGNCTDTDEVTVEVQACVGNQPPTDLALSPTSIAENNAVNAVVGTFTTTDPDAGDSHTYSLVSGSGDADNASFTIVGNELRANISFDFEVKSSYSIRVRTTDQGNLAYEGAFTITITDVNEGGGPAVISLVPVSLPVSANEGPGFTEYRIDVVLTPVPNQTYPVSVQFNTSGTAIRGQAAGVNSSCGSKTVRDYSIAPSPASGPVTLTWSSKLTSVARQLSIRINGDDCPEPDEDFTITLLNPVNATLGTSTFTHTIVNDDAPRLGADGEEETLTTGLTLYPNPTQGTLTLAFWATAESVESLQVLDVAGRVVHTQTVNTVEGRNEVALDLSAQPAGVYFVQALGQTAKVVIAK